MNLCVACQKEFTKTRAHGQSFCPECSLKMNNGKSEKRLAVCVFCRVEFKPTMGLTEWIETKGVVHPVCSICTEQVKEQWCVKA